MQSGFQSSSFLHIFFIFVHSINGDNYAEYFRYYCS